MGTKGRREKKVESGGSTGAKMKPIEKICQTGTRTFRLIKFVPSQRAHNVYKKIPSSILCSYRLKTVDSHHHSRLLRIDKANSLNKTPSGPSIPKSTTITGTAID